MSEIKRARIQGLIAVFEEYPNQPLSIGELTRKIRARGLMVGGDALRYIMEKQEEFSMSGKGTAAKWSYQKGNKNV